MVFQDAPAQDNSMISFTVGSRKYGRVGLREGVSSPGFGLTEPHGAQATVFQSEVYAIVLNARENLTKKQSGKIIYILSDGQAVTARAL